MNGVFCLKISFIERFFYRIFIDVVEYGFSLREQCKWLEISLSSHRMFRWPFFCSLWWRINEDLVHLRKVHNLQGFWVHSHCAGQSNNCSVVSIWRLMTSFAAVEWINSMLIIQWNRISFVVWNDNHGNFSSNWNMKEEVKISNIWTSR